MSRRPRLWCAEKNRWKILKLNLATIKLHKWKNSATLGAGSPAMEEARKILSAE
jgi:hypothetical protein